MNFMDPEKTHALVVGIFVCLSIGGSIMGMMVTSETRGGTGGWKYIFGGIALAVIGWMFIDYIWFPENKQLPIMDFVKQWWSKKLS